MAIELKVPEVGESITEVVIGEWLKAVGDSVEQDENLVIIETDKVNVELPAPQSGTLVKIVIGDGEEATVGDVIGLMEAGDAAAGGGDDRTDAKAAEAAAGAEEEKAEEDDASDADEEDDAGADEGDAGKAQDAEVAVSPAARRLLAEAGLEPAEVAGSGKGGRILKEDVQRHLDAGDPEPAEKKAAEEPAAEEPPAEKPAAEKPAAEKPAAEKPARRPAAASVSGAPGREEEVVPLSPLRKRVAERLVQAQREAAILTTFNEIDMSAVIALRKRHQEAFQGAYGIKLGFMSFFVKATIEALKAVPGVNGQFRDGDVVYHNYYDIGVAVGGGKGLVVPVVRNAERLSFAEVEQAIADLASRARENKLTLEELQGGTFTISNGGVYGSLLSTPILNPPQTGILGLHKIEERPVAVDGEVVVRPMMYVALSYDHRLIDGREAVTFLVKIKERIEDPTRILLEI